MFSTFDLFFPPVYQQPRVVVLSDTDYKQYQKEKAQQELLVLESKRNRLASALEAYDNDIKELCTTYQIEPVSLKELASSDKKETADALS